MHLRGLQRGGIDGGKRLGEHERKGETMTTGKIVVVENVEPRQVCEYCQLDKSACRRSHKTGKVMHVRQRSSGVWTLNGTVTIKARVEKALSKRSVKWTAETKDGRTVYTYVAGKERITA